MKSNMGTTDRVIRMIAGLVILALYLTHRISGTLAIVLGAIAVAFIVSSFFAWCPAYAPFGWSTKGKGS